MNISTGVPIRQPPVGYIDTAKAISRQANICYIWHMIRNVKLQQVGSVRTESIRISVAKLHAIFRGGSTQRAIFATERQLAPQCQLEVGRIID
jgi:hypothetical protein